MTVWVHLKFLNVKASRLMLRIIRKTEKNQLFQNKIVQEMKQRLILKEKTN